MADTATGQLDHHDHDHEGLHAHEGDHGHHNDYAPALGRYITHPPEPPHLIMIWYKNEQKALISDYMAAHPGAAKPKVVENWLQKDADGNWVEVPGQSPTLAQVLHAGTAKQPLPLVGYLPWENHVYFVLAGIVLVSIFMALTRSFRRDRKEAIRRPTRSQAVIEMIVGGFDEFCKGVLGNEHGRRYMPFIGTLFCLILVSNLMGMVPAMKAPTSYVLLTFSLALCSFVIVQATAWTKLGPLTYIHHLMGSPKDAIGWVMAPLFLLLEIISDFAAKPLSLALRLFGNILGKDILLGSFMGMGISLVALLPGSLGNYFGLPLTVPFILLGLLLSTIQALVFALLTAIYISLVLPHGHHDHDEHHDEGHGHEKGHGSTHEALPA